MTRKITADEFLEALNLPSEHPYAPPKGEAPLKTAPKQEWSVSSYFNSWKDTPAPINSIKTASQCDWIPPPWAKTPLGNDVATEDICQSPSQQYSVHQDYTNDNGDVQDLVPFLSEVKPCLVSMIHMNIILWAPLVVMLCLMKIYLPKAGPLHLHHKEQVNREKSPNKKSGFIIALPNCVAPSLRKASSEHNSQSSHTERNDNAMFETTSFERMLLLLTLFLNAVTVVSAVFTEEKKTKATASDEGCGPNKARQLDEDNTDERHIPRANTSDAPFIFTSEWGAYAVALCFTAVVMNDAQYVLSFSQANLAALHLFVISVALTRFGAKITLTTALPISAIGFYIMLYKDLELPPISPGLYYDDANPFISRVVQEWPAEERAYDNGTPWMMTGDTRTGLPFMLYDVPKQHYVRRWVPLPGENEAVILDIAFPPEEAFNDDKQVYLVLHGINGDSNEGYVVDFVHRQVSRGNVVAVMVTRGLGDSTVFGDNFLHFARVSDVSAATKALKDAIHGVSPDKDITLAGVGYSMGAITLANFVASDPNCALDVGIAFSGALDTKEQIHFHRSAHLWQPFIAKAMRDTLMRRYSAQIRQRFDEKQMKKVMTASSLVDLDRELFAPYNDFKDLEGYYEKMGAMGDFDRNGYDGKISNVKIPLLCVQSLDDPIGWWKTFHDPIGEAKSGDGKNVLLFTRTGGHVGWPIGWNPSLHGWRWMSDVASSFAEAVDRVQ